MVEIGGKPILWHILNTYSHYGINEFVICCGYNGYMRKGHLEKSNYEHEAEGETHLLLRLRPLCFSGLRQFFVVPKRILR